MNKNNCKKWKNVKLLKNLYNRAKKIVNEDKFASVSQFVNSAVRQYLHEFEAGGTDVNVPQD